ncbi:D-cysteine desulfhydrase [Labrys neptuniae]
MQLNRFPRLRFCHTPTPLEPMEALSRHLGGPRIYIKRDDCTGLAFGGNKTRKLEYLVAEALAEGADTLVTAGGVQSNHCRQTAAVAARHGLACELVLSRNVARNNPNYDQTGNVLLDRLFGARLHFVPGNSQPAVELERIAQGVREHGGRPYVMPIGGSTATGALGYVGCAHELLQQAAALGIVIDSVVHCTGSGGTQAGLLVGLSNAGGDIAVTGISVAEPRAVIERRVYDLCLETAEKLGVPHSPESDRVVVLDDHVGPGYGLPSEGMQEAVELCAQHEGLLLDPVYTGKAMAGLIALIRQKRFDTNNTVIFLHTGGTPALFAYDDVLPGPMTGT